MHTASTCQGVVEQPLVTINISLNSPCGVYEPGQVLSGRVNLRAEEDVPLYAVYLWVIGQAEVTWVDSPESSAKTGFDYEIYLKECFVLWGQGQDHGGEQSPGSRDPTSSAGGNTGVLSAGLHQFDFHHKLPPKLPTSFESRADQPRLDRSTRGQVQQKITASVRYLLRVKLDSTSSPLRRMCHDCAFIVLRPLDLNTIHQTPLSLRTSKTTPSAAVKPFPPIDESVLVHRDMEPGCGWYPCRSGLVTCSLRLDRRAFVPGEDISVNLQIENLNRREVSRSFVAMTQIVHVYVAGVRHSTDCDVFCISGGKVKSGDNAYYHDIIHIPPLPPSRLDGCNIVNIEYIIKAGVMLSGSSVAVVEIAVPIMIGTVPLKHLIMPGVHMSPIYQRYDQTSGEIENFTDEDFTRGRHRDVYVYYRCTFSRKILSALQGGNGVDNGTLITGLPR